MTSTSKSPTAIIVGGGGSGLAAACAIAQRGGRALVLEKQPFLGGTTGIAVGTFTGAGTSLQRERGIADDPRAHDEDAGKFAPQHEARNNGPLRQFFLREAAATFEWLRTLGLTFHGPNPEPPNRVPRMHNVVPGAKAYIVALQYEVQRGGGEIRCGVDVVGLVREGERIVGVRVAEAGQTREYRAERGVILAAGDYANNPDMIRRYKGDEFGAIEGINPHATGAGHRLAEEAGGTLVNMDIAYGPELRFIPPARRPFQQVLPTGKWATRFMGWAYRQLPKRWQSALIKRLLVTWQHPENALFDDGAILLNAHGERFVNEKSWPEREIAVARQPGKIAYLLLDRRLCERYSAWPHFISTAPEIAYAYVKDYERLRPDVTCRAADLEHLDPLASVVAKVRESVAASTLGEGPWVLLGPVKAYFTTTEGGVLVNERMQVLSAEGVPIAGLYAVGQVGLAGMVLFGHGLHIAWAMTSGRLAGTAVME